MIYGITFILEIIIAIIVVVDIASLWIIFKKAGESGWKAIIPFYNNFTLYKICGMSTAWIAVDIASAILKVLTNMTKGVAINANSYGLVMTILSLSLVVSVMSLILTIMYSINLCKVFDLGVGYMIGMIFVPFVFLPIIAYNDNIKYLGRNVNDYGLSDEENAGNQ